MKKLVFVLTALLCAQTLAAGVDIWCVDEGSGVVAVHYQADSDANLPRGFGLNIALDNDANITAVSDFADGSNDGKNQYWVYPGQIVIVDNDVCEVNTPLASAVDTNSIIVEMGSLHWPTAANSPNAPATSGVLCKFTVDGDCTVTISGNTARGNVVLYDATAADTNLPSSCEVALWPCDCMGDIDDSGWVYVDDYQEMLVLLLNNSMYVPGPGYGDDPNYDPCVDYDHSNYLYTDDLQALLVELLADADKFWMCP